MKYLYFDTECANEFNNLACMCSFGYVITDDNFNVLESDDLFIDPESYFDRRVLRDVLFYDKAHYINNPNFKEQYQKIKSLFEDAIVIGHAIDNDIRILNDACDRYKLPRIEIKNYYDTQMLYAAYNNMAFKETSLAKIALELDIERQGERHTSVQDARISMLVLKKIAHNLEFSLKDTLSFCRKQGSLDYKMPKNTTNNKLRHKDNYLIYKMFQHETVPEPGYEPLLKDKVVSISNSYERVHFKETLYLIQQIYNYGGTYENKASLANLYVSYNPEGIIDVREVHVNEENEKGKNIEKISLADFCKLINFNEAEVDKCYELKKEQFYHGKKEKEYLSREEVLEKDFQTRMHFTHKKETKFSINLGDLFKDILN